MSTTPDLVSCLGTEDGRSTLVPLSPFTSLRFNFGMLLGVDDFETEQAYHRAKSRMHNAWLHREGVIWGFGVNIDKAAAEIRVAPGLAIDSAGRELHLEDEACLNVGEWFNKHEHDVDFQPTAAGDQRTFNAHVVIRFKACLTRQIPALMEPCENAGTGTAYSRVFETVEILLLPNHFQKPIAPYHRLRLLFGLDAPQQQEGSTNLSDADQEVIDEVNRIKALGQTEQIGACVSAFHRFAALDEIDMRPGNSDDDTQRLLFPGRETDPVVLADITDLTITRKDSAWVLDGGSVDSSVRPTHVATTTLQDLICGTLGEVITGDVGPGIDPNSVDITDTKITLKADQQLHASTVQPSNFSVSVFNAASGWSAFDLKTTLEADGQTITLEPTASPFSKGLTRLIARGTGPTPLLGTNNLPLAGQPGSTGSPRGTDFVLMKERN